MSITRSMWTGASSLFANGTAIGVVGDNIANVNTVGYRGSTAFFADVLSQRIVGVGEVGGGVTMQKVHRTFQQGAILGTGTTTDMAINGRGFFVLRGQHGSLNGNFFSRAGAMRLDNDGYLVNPEGLYLQGYATDASGNFDSTISDLQVDNRLIPPNATTDVTLTVNVIPETTIETAAFDPAAPNSAFTRGLTVYDAQGTAHDVTLHFVRSASQEWTWYAVGEGSELAGGTPGPTVMADGVLTFDTDGLLTTQVINNNTIDFANTTPGQVIDFDFSGSTHFSSADYDVSSLTQDGYAAGELSEVTIGAGGLLVGKYNNGQTRSLARIVLADFTNLNGLEAVGGTLFASTIASGEPLIGQAGSGRRGTIVGSALEQSNVDLPTEFVKLITDQRAYQAASRTITTADELLVETVNLKR